MRYARTGPQAYSSVRPISSLSYQDRAFTQTYCRRNFRFRTAPEWVFDDDQVRRVVGAQVALLAYTTHIPQDLRMLRLLSRHAIKMLKKSPSWEWHQLARAAGRKGLPAYLTAIIYKTYRIGHDSVQLATDLRVSPQVIRQALHRMKQTATRLDGDRVIYRFRGSKGMRPRNEKPALTAEKAPTRRRKYHRLDYQVLADMWRAGLSMPEIAKQLGATRIGVRYALRVMGFDTNRKRKGPEAFRPRPCLSPRNESVESPACRVTA